MMIGRVSRFCIAAGLCSAMMFLPWASAGAGEAGSTAPSVAQAPVPVPQPSELALRYYWSGNVLWIANLVWALTVPLVVLFTGYSARIRDWAQRVGRKWMLVIAVYFIVYSAINYLLDLPLNFYADFIREHAYGLSNQTFGKWFRDSLISYLVAAMQGALFLWIPYLLLKRSPRRWWLYTSLLVVPFLCFQLFIAPILIDPLFNKFGPMRDKELEAKILALADQAGIAGSQVYEVEKSADTKTVNAYVTGFMGTKRIVLWDTTLAKLEPDQVLFIVGHEIGHYVMGHIFSTILFISGVIAVALYGIYRISGSVIRRFEKRFRFSELHDVASLPLLLVLVQSFAVILSPIVLGYSRYHEREADRFGLELTRDNHAAATAFVRLQQENLDNPRPGPVFRFWRSSHPSLAERVEFCNTYHPWLTGGPLRYDNYLVRGHSKRNEFRHEK